MYVCVNICVCVAYARIFIFLCVMGYEDVSKLSVLLSGVQCTATASFECMRVHSRIFGVANQLV